MATKGSTPPAQPPVEDATTTGGNGDGDGDSQISQAAVQAAMAVADDDYIVKARKDLVTAGADDKTRLPGFSWSFNPNSLVGSWFHRLENGEMVWQGVVVGEPHSGVYLCQIDTLDVGATQVQRLITIQQLTTDDDGYDWRFYDSEAAAQKAYVDWMSSGRARAEA